MNPLTRLVNLPRLPFKKNVAGVSRRTEHGRDQTEALAIYLAVAWLLHLSL